jgi:plasmid stabilization system protein ParE
MRARVRIARPAAAQTKEIAAWWAKNRPRAPALFRQELAGVLQLLRTAPEMGAVYPVRGIPGMRRVLLPRTQFHVYYVYSAESSRIDVIAVWHAARGKPPPLRLA